MNVHDNFSFIQITNILRTKVETTLWNKLLPNPSRELICNNLRNIVHRNVFRNLHCFIPKRKLFSKNRNSYPSESQLEDAYNLRESL